MDIWAPGAGVSEYLPFNSLIITLEVSIAEMNVSEPSKNVFQCSSKTIFAEKTLQMVELDDYWKEMARGPYPMDCEVVL